MKSRERKRKERGETEATWGPVNRLVLNSNNVGNSKHLSQSKRKPQSLGCLLSAFPGSDGGRVDTSELQEAEVAAETQTNAASPAHILELTDENPGLHQGLRVDRNFRGFHNTRTCTCVYLVKKKMSASLSNGSGSLQLPTFLNGCEITFRLKSVFYCDRFCMQRNGPERVFVPWLSWLQCGKHILSRSSPDLNVNRDLPENRAGRLGGKTGPQTPFLLLNDKRCVYCDCAKKKQNSVDVAERSPLHRLGWCWCDTTPRVVVLAHVLRLYKRNVR